jgi:dihydrodipicolinate synthase/N-acetylneuraminate lyase
VRFEGVIPMLQTPFHEDGSLDFSSLRRQVEFVRAAGVAMACYPGFASEWWKLSEIEILQAAQTIVDSAAGRLSLIGNVTAQSTHLAIEQARAFQEMGCVGLMCLPPFVVPQSPHAITAHLRAVMSAVPLPHIVQYSASLTGIRLETSQLKALRAEYPQFCSIKVDFIPPGPIVSELRSALGDDEFTYLIGFAGLQLADCLKRGAHGLMGGTGHLREDLAVFNALREDPNGRGIDAFHELLPLLNAEMQTIDHSIATHKWLLKNLGVFETDHVRQPGPHLDGAAAAELGAHFRRIQAKVSS